MKFLDIVLSKKVISAFVLSLGIALAGYGIGNSLLKFRLLERHVAVKGLAEQEVESDLANWLITAKVTANDLSECHTKIESDKKQIIDFLINQGFDPEEIKLGDYTVNDLLAQTYRQDNYASRYLISSTIILKTRKVKLTQKAAQLQNLLTEKGVIVENQGPYYEFTRFNDLKPKLLAEAIKNARKAAEKFSHDAHTKIGQLKKANQGLFIITRPSGEIESDNSYENGLLVKKSLLKKIRVVATLEYFLDTN